ncbi:helix-turn-helix transcriptional regulator [Yoonia sp. GPGPB17]|uniref:response regulator transcription factor n=1 Tax=Yoonia sp. GPGPB17 TaxID=3026147 RepID=UPI0030C1ECCB
MSQINADGRLIDLPDDEAKTLAAFSDVLNVGDHLSIVCPDSGHSSELAAHLTDPFSPLHRSFVLYSRRANADVAVHLLKQSLERSLVVINIHKGVSSYETLSLTPREKDVVRLAARGLRRDRMAHALGISVATIDLHCANLRHKLNARTTAEAVAKATVHRWLVG